MRKKITLVSISVALIAVLVAGMSLAYFTDTTEKKENVFTVGNVDISLDEPSWDADKEHPLTPSQSYEKDPTITVEQGSQDSYVFLKMDMNKFMSLLRLMGMNAYADGTLQGEYQDLSYLNQLLSDKTTAQAIIDKWFGGIEHENWTVLNLPEIQQTIQNAVTDADIKNLEIVLGYNDVVSAGDEVTFMDSFTMPATVTSEMLEASNFNTEKAAFKITFTAGAIQANDGDDQFEDVEAAYSAFGSFADYEG